MKKIFPLLAAFCFFLLGLVTLSDYGVNWDSNNHYTRGQALLRYLRTGEEDYKNWTPKTKRVSIYQAPTRTARYFLEKKYFAHPPLPDILASIFNVVFYQKLGILGDIESYHLFIVLVSSFLVYVVFHFVQEIYGIFAAVIAFLSLVLYPLFLAEFHLNIKDPVETAFYTLTLYFFYQGIIKNKSKHLFFSAISCGLALGTKWNIVFLPFILGPWLLISQRKNLKKLPWLTLFLYPLLAFGVFVVGNPLIWPSPFKKTLEIFGWYKRIGGSSAHYQPASFYFLGFNTYPFLTVLYTTPLVILFFSFLGIIAALLHFRQERERPSFLILLWFLVPILRVTIPGSSIYGGLRQIMEYIPAMAILSGLGASQMVKWLNGQMVKWLKKKPFSHLPVGKAGLAIQPLILLQALTLLMFLPIFIKMIQIHPFQNAYFNPLIGGLKGAKERDYPDWGVTLGTQYRQGAEWLNKHAEKNAKLALLVSTRVTVPETYLREDINFANSNFSRKERKGEYLMEAIYDDWIRVYYYCGEFGETFLKPVHEIKVDGVPIFKIWKNDPEHTYPRFLNEKTMEADKISWRKKEETILIEMPAVVELMEVIVDYNSIDCSPFEAARVLLSFNGEDWRLVREPIKEYMTETGKLIYPLVAKEAKYVKIQTTPENACVFKINNIVIKHI